MYSTKGRYVLVALFAVSCLVSIYFSQYQLAAIAGFLALFTVWAHMKQGTVLQASKHFQNQDYDEAERLLNQIKNPDLLAKNRRGFYEFMRANIALHRKDYEAAEYHFQLASRFPLGGKNDKAYVLIHLANLALRKKDATRVDAYLERAKKCAVTSRANELIEKIEKEKQKINS